MHDLASWSLNLGRWGGMHVRLHALFILFAIGTLCLGATSGEADLIWIGWALVGLLLISVLLHELGHCYAAYREGGYAEQIVIGPLGGLAAVHVPRDPRSELITALAGPAVNLGVCLALGPILWLGAEINPLGLLHPLAPQSLAEGSRLVVIGKLAFWINWLLLLVNLLPAFPFDGGQALRCALWQQKGHRSAVLIVAGVAKLTALGLLLVAMFVSNEYDQAPIPAWAPLVLLAVFLYFSAKQEVARLDRHGRDDESLGYDFSQGYVSLQQHEERPREEPLGLLAQWRQKRRHLKDQQRRELEESEEARVDEILARLHERGMDGLAPEDRAVLQRVSARYRNRSS
ncbi:MAG: site-2 protease family protein [Pirellulales bacterium]